MPRRSPLIAFAVFLVSFASALAHDPRQSWMSAVNRSDAMELTITMATINALRLIDREASAPLTRERFPELRPRFAELAGTLCRVTSKSELRPKTIDVVFTEENDLAFTLLFSPAPHDTLRIDAAFLQKLGEEFTSMLVVTDDAGVDLGWNQLTVEKSILEISLPARPTPPKT